MIRNHRQLQEQEIVSVVPCLERNTSFSWVSSPAWNAEGTRSVYRIWDPALGFKEKFRAITANNAARHQVSAFRTHAGSYLEVHGLVASTDSSNSRF